MSSVSKTIGAQNTFSDSLPLVGHFNLSISGTFVATVTVQRSFDSGSTWLDVDTFTAATETYGFDPQQVYYRAGVKTGDYTSGSVVVSLYEDAETSRSIRLS